jgi:hypothetical protein
MYKATTLAVVASACTATSSLCQRLGASQAEPGGFDPAPLFRLAVLPWALAAAGFSWPAAAARRPAS